MDVRLRGMALALAAAFCANAADGVAEGENILSNPIFESDQQPTPAFWHVTAKDSTYSWSATGGPDASPAIVFSAKKDGTFAVRQSGLRLAAPGRYRISCRVKARGFSAKAAGFDIAEPGWRHPTGMKIEQGTYGWRRIEKVAEIDRPTNDGTWFAVAHAERFSGEIWITDVAISPADATTAQGTDFSRETAIREAPRLVPMKPVLSLIPADDRRVFFSFFGRLRDDASPQGADPRDYDVVIKADGGVTRTPLSREMFAAALPKEAKGGRFEASVVRRDGGREIFRRSFPYRVVALPAKPTRGNRLNNLVEEFENREMPQGASADVRLAFRKDTWLYIAADAQSVKFDGAEMPGLRYPNRETFLEAEAGTHTLSVKGANGGRLVVRRIPETLDYQTFEGDFQRKFVLPSVTTLDGGRVARDTQRMFRETGHLHIGNVSMTDFKDVAEIKGSLDINVGMTDPDYDGVTCDELNPWSARKMSDFAEMLWAYRAAKGKRIYSWVVGKPFFKATDHDAVSAILNACGGKGRLLNEFYCRTRETEEEAREHVRDWLAGNLRAWEGFSPVLKHGYAPIFGAYTEMRYGSSVAPHCEVDYRHYLDMQFNILANDPAFVDIPCTGVWGTNYSDPEIKGWTFRLLRHYCVEGRRTMLSDRFGLKYRPGHLKNCDFAQGLDGWRASGNVQGASVEGFGLESELRGGKNLPPIGDTFAELRGAGASVAQTATGLVPGKCYLLEFKTFSPEDARTHRKVDRTAKAAVKAAVKVSGGRICDEATYMKARSRPKAKTGAVVTDNRIVFVADSQEADIAFSTEGGNDVGINSISLRLAIELAVR